MKISTLRMYKFFQKDNPFDEPDNDWLVALKWAGLSILVLIAIGIVGCVLWVIFDLLRSLYTETWVWVRVVVTPFLILPFVVLWLAWPTKKRQAAVFLEGKK